MVLNSSRKTNFFYYSFKASKNKQELSFYSIPEFDEWKKHIENQKAWKIKYYKGRERERLVATQELFTALL